MQELFVREKISLEASFSIINSEECCLGLIRSAGKDVHLLLAKGQATGFNKSQIGAKDYATELMSLFLLIYSSLGSSKDSLTWGNFTYRLGCTIAWRVWEKWLFSLYKGRGQGKVFGKASAILVVEYSHLAREPSEVAIMFHPQSQVGPSTYL